MKNSESRKLLDFICGLSPLTIAVIINAIFLIIFLLSGTMKFEVSDDFMMELLFSGESGVSSPYSLFINVIVGYFIYLLYFICDSINWYFIFHVSVIFISLVSITYSIVSKNKNKLGMLFIIIFLLFFSNDLYQLIQFTKTSTISILAGVLFFFDYIFNDKSNKIILVCGYILFLVGICIRFKSLYIIIMGGLLAYFFLLFTLYKKDSRNLKKYLKKSVISVFCICSIIVFVKSVDNLYAFYNPEISDYQIYNLTRSQILDYPYFNYETNREKFESINLSENEFLNIIHWNFADPSFYNLEKMQSVRTILQDSRDNIYKLGFTDSLNILFDRNYYKYISFIGLIILILLTWMLKKDSLYFSILVLFLSFIELFLFVRMGRLVYRVEYSVFLSLSGFIVYIIQYLQNKNIQQYNKMFIYIVLISCIIHVPFIIPNSTHDAFSIMNYSSDNSIRKYNLSFNTDNVQNNLIEEIVGNRHNIYFLGFSTTIQSIYLNYSPFSGVKSNIFQNAIYFAGVYTEHPTQIQQLQKFGISNIMESLLDENVYLVDNDFYLEILEFLKKHYNSDVDIELYKEVDGYKIWKYKVN